MLLKFYWVAIDMSSYQTHQRITSLVGNLLHFRGRIRESGSFWYQNIAELQKRVKSLSDLVLK